jgi:hypothetical protein
MRAIVGGWSIDTVYSFYSGQFLTPACSGPDPTGTTYTTGTTPATVTIRPNYLHDTNLPVDQRTVSRWFDVSAFAAPTPGSFGSAAKGVIKGPGLNQWDAGIAKNIVFLERVNLRWEMTATNFFNHPAWSNPATNIADLSQAGVISGAAGSHSLDQPGARAFRMGIRLEF